MMNPWEDLKRVVTCYQLSVSDEATHDAYAMVLHEIDRIEKELAANAQREMKEKVLLYQLRYLEKEIREHSVS